MAKYKDGINGPFLGKIGPVTGSSWLGVPYMKSNNSVRAERVPSVAQLHQRMVFAMVSSWLKPMKDWIGIGYANVTGRTPMNAAVSFVLKHVVTSVGPGLTEGCSGHAVIDYTKMVWSRGELLMSLMTKFELSDAGENGTLSVPTVRIEWLNALYSYYNRPDDRAVFIFYNASDNGFAVFDQAAVRADGAVELSLDGGIGSGEVFGWMFYYREDGLLSTSVYCGRFSQV